MHETGLLLEPPRTRRFFLARPGSVSSSPRRGDLGVRRAERWSFIDVLRGVALAGILFVNTLDITALGLGRLERGAEPVADPVREVLYLTVQTRFVPIFAALFGMSIWFVLSGARSRARWPWSVLVRRLLTLSGAGLLLELVYPGNILTEYGVIGLLVLPAVLFVPPRVLLAVGGLLTVVLMVLIGSNAVSDLGLMLFGAGAAGCGVPALLQRAGRGVALVFVASVIVSVPLVLWQLTEPGDARFTQAGPVAGLAMAVAYATGLSLLWRTPARRLLSVVFEPLGRMALSNYVTAAEVVFLAARAVDFGSMTSALPAVLLAAVIIAAQSLVSRGWLSRFRYGPFEWVWRMATWLQPVSLRRAARLPRPAAALRAGGTG